MPDVQPDDEMGEGYLDDDHPWLPGPRTKKQPSSVEVTLPGGTKVTREILSGAQAPGFIRHRVKPSTERPVITMQSARDCANELGRETGSVCALHFVTQCIHPVTQS